MIKFLSIVFLATILYVGGCKPEQPNEVEKTTNMPTPLMQAKADVKPEKLSDWDNHKTHNHNMVLDTVPEMVLDTLVADSVPETTDSIKLRILSIGNSYARDAFGYVPFLLSELVPNLKLNFTIMYVGGRPLKDHWNALQTGAPEYERDVYTTEAGVWTTEKGRSLTSELDSVNNQWDIVILQQASGDSPRYDSYQPYLHDIMGSVRATQKAKVGWLLTPAHPDGYEKMPTTTGNVMWQLVCDAVARLTKEETVDFVIPGGTAVQNARHTKLDSLGVFGHMTFDGLHLQDGLPCLVESYTATQTLLNTLGIPKNISNSKIILTQQWAVERHVPQMHGRVIEGTAEDYNLCKTIALRSLLHPYNLYIVL